MAGLEHRARRASMLNERGSVRMVEHEPARDQCANAGIRDDRGNNPRWVRDQRMPAAATAVTDGCRRACARQTLLASVTSAASSRSCGARPDRRADRGKTKPTHHTHQNNSAA
jgi:hypothetical protein